MSKKFRYLSFNDSGDDLDSNYWANASDEEKFAEAWRLVVLALELQGKSKDELRFQRSACSIQRQEY